MKLLMRDEAKGREHTIFVTIFSALMVMLAIVVMLMASATAISGVTLQLDENAVDILDKQVENRAGYIQDQLQQAQELTDLSTYINETTQQMLDDETLSLKTLDSSSSDSLPLLQAAAPRMLETLRSKRISGIFLILNTHDFTGRTSGDRLPCVYLRDLDPDAAPSVVNSDILLECAPSELVQTFDIATDKAWSPALQYLDGEQDVFYVRPFQTAYEDDERMGAANYGRWTTLPYKLRGDDREAIAYAQPLILDDGTVYGVLGVELLESYMDTKLPWDELQNDHHGSYLLASTTSDLRGEVLTLHVTSNTGEQSVPLQNAKWELTLQRSNNCWYYMMDGKQQIASIRQIGLYSRNAPFSGERWLLVGVVGGNDLFSFSQSVTKLLGLAVLLTLGIGLACAFFVSYGLAQPIAQLSKELMDAQEQRKAVPEFSRTGIRELDQLAEAIVTLSTDNYKAAVAERSRIEHERDYDALTGLYSRQAFFRVCGELFEKPNTLRHAALMMTDLDNLKTINDTYGHDWGDVYLRQTAHSLQQGSPSGTVVARLSGDEFLLLFYGYDSQDAIRKELSTLNGALRASCSTLPNGKTLNISISGGVAWFPEDGTDLKTLKKYADFAMYQVKQSHKGHTGDFDIGVYHREEYAAQTQREFEQLLREELVTYYFQPIFSAHSGRVAAYEALMRVNMPTITSPSQVMTLAHELDRLYDIERITLFKSGETYEQLQQKGLLQNGAFLFVNSIANVSLTPADVAKYQRRFPELLKYLVVEITEQEDLDRDSLERKRNVPGFSGSFALDDYGSGYSNELNLLALAPRYIKIDISIVRGIDTDRDKQQIVSNIVDYAHARSMQLIAEGIENDAELRKVIDLGVDLLQGFYLSRPAAVPAPLAQPALDTIRRIHTRNSSAG